MMETPRHSLRPEVTAAAEAGRGTDHRLVTMLVENADASGLGGRRRLTTWR